MELPKIKFNGIKNICQKYSINPSQIYPLLGLNRNTFYCYWYGTRRPSPETAHKICQFLSHYIGQKITLEDIYGLKDEEE